MQILSLRETPGRQIRRVNDWNARHPTGTKVNVITDDGAVIQTKTTSLAWMLAGHTAVISLDGIAGGYRLQRVSVFVVTEDPTLNPAL